MSLSAFLGVSLSVIAFSTLVVGEPKAIITLNSLQVKNNANDFFDPWTVDIVQGDESSKLSAKIPTKAEVPEPLLVKMTIIMDGQDPMEFESTFCDGLSDETAGKSFVEAGTPKGEFPNECPFVAGDWGVFEWDPSGIVPPGIPDGPFHGTLLLWEEGKDPCIQIDYEGEITHAAPGMRR